MAWRTSSYAGWPPRRTRPQTGPWRRSPLPIPAQSKGGWELRLEKQSPQGKGAGGAALRRNPSWRRGSVDHRKDTLAMLLAHKVAVVYGAGGAIGGAIARTFALEGARVFLAGRTQATLDAVAGEIHAQGGLTDTAVVDALDEQAVNAFVDAVVAQGYRPIQP